MSQPGKVKAQAYQRVNIVCGRRGRVAIVVRGIQQNSQTDKLSSENGAKGGGVGQAIVCSHDVVCCGNVKM
jgi:hypothetical protein